MRRLVAFDNVTLDGCFAGVNGEISWAHQGSQDPEFTPYALSVKGDTAGQWRLWGFE
jgi:hypothetical protein